MKKFNNSAAKKESKKSINHKWIAESYSTDWCKAKCEEIEKDGGKAFYKKTGEKYTVYSFTV